MEKKRTAATFFTAFILALCVLGLGVACLLIECNLQTTLYGRVDPGVGFSMAAGVPVLTDTDTGQPITLLSEPQQQGLTALLPPGWRVILELLREELAFIAEKMT